jgi:hypothetical protein
MIILPRQARDKHRENSKNETVFKCAGFSLRACLAKSSLLTYLGTVELTQKSAVSPDGGVGMIAQIKAVDEKLLTWETETPCGGGRSKVCGNGPGTHNNSWSWGEGQFSYMRSFLESGASVYSQWNMVFKKTAVPPYFLDKNDRFTKT